MDRHRAQPNLALPDNEQRTVALPSDRSGLPLLATDEMLAAKAWLENIEVPPLADERLLAIHGWLSPDGALYACGWEKHDVLTAALGFEHESAIEAAGYCKLTALKWLVGPRYCRSGLTDDQWETIEQWYERNGFPEEHFLRLCSSA